MCELKILCVFVCFLVLSTLTGDRGSCWSSVWHFFSYINILFY